MLEQLIGDSQALDRALAVKNYLTKMAWN